MRCDVLSPVSVSAVLGFHSMLTQTQFYASLRDEKIHEGGFTGEVALQVSPVALQVSHVPLQVSPVPLQVSPVALQVSPVALRVCVNVCVCV